MKTMGQTMILLIFLGVISGCAAITPTLEKPIEKSKVFESTYEETWNVLLQTLTTSGELIAVAQKDSGLISFQRKIPLDKFKKVVLAPDGVLPLANHWVIVFPIAQINILVSKPSDKQTLVTINVKIVGDFGKPWTTFRAQELDSNGTLEKEYLDEFSSRISKQSF